jgi:integrase
MKIALTDRTVSQVVPPQQGRLEVFDTKMPGLALRVAPSGHKSWTVVWHRGRQTRRYAFGSYPAVTLASAREQARQVLAGIARGEDPAAERASTRFVPTIAALAKDYIERYAKARKRSWKADERTLRVDILPVLGRMRASEVQRKHVRALLDDIMARGTAARPCRTHANRVRALLHALFAFGVRREVLASNPVDGVERQPERPREKVLTSDEVRAIFAALEDEPAMMQAYVRLLFLTASRGGELLRLRAENATFEPEAWLTFPAEITKAKREHRVPLSVAAVAVLRDLREHNGSGVWLFPSTKSKQGRRTANQDFYKRMRAKSAVAFVGHDARRWCATTMAASGVSTDVVGRILGHADQSVTTRHYAKASYATEMRRALELLARKLDAVLTGETASKVVPLRA